MAEPPSYVVVLTGGIAAGKSAVSHLFQALGIHTYDADIGAREVVMPGTPGLAKIIDVFGPAVLQADGQLDRRAMRERVFADAGARRQLEAIVHPHVDAWLRDKVRNDPGPWCLLAIPLLVETWPQYAWVDRILLVEAAREQRIQRLMQRDNIDIDAAGRMLAAQADDARRHELADDIINNDGDLQDLQVAVESLYKRYQERARAPSR